MVHALWLACKEEGGELDESRKNFTTSCLPTSPAGFFSDLPAILHATVSPFVFVKRSLSKMGDPLANLYAALSMVLFIFAYVRYTVRGHLKIEHGDLLTDMCI